MLRYQAATRNHAAVNNSLRRYCRRVLEALQNRGDTASPVRIIGLTSLRKGEGVSTVASHLAWTAAEDWQRPVLVVDAHLRRPRLHRIFRLPLSPGLRDALADPRVSSLNEQLASPQLSVLTAGKRKRRGPPTAELVEFLPDLLSASAESFASVFVDLPPLAECTSCPPLLQAVDGMILVAESERLTREAIQGVRESLEFAGGDRLLGFIINKKRSYVPKWIDRLMGAPI